MTPASREPNEQNSSRKLDRGYEVRLSDELKGMLKALAREYFPDVDRGAESAVIRKLIREAYSKKGN